MVDKRGRILKKKSIRNVASKSKKNIGGRKRKLTNDVWSRLPTELLLDLRMCDLDLSIKGTVLEGRIAQVCRELERRTLRFRPYFWISDDWFTPERSTGAAIPFYLTHPRLTRLERNQTGEVEGGTREWCMKLLRHEVGHMIEHAFRLHRRRRWQQLFGLSSHSYPRCYRPNPYSKRYVHHLEYWYAQSHPVEDFAETFAVWLQPQSKWRKHYHGWPAIRKLEYVDELMAEIAGKKPLVRSRAHEDSLATLKQTLREHYKQNRPLYTKDYTVIYDRDLCQFFTDKRGRTHREAASAFIRRVRPKIYRLTASWIGEYRYQLDHVIKDMIGRCRELKLYVRGTERQSTVQFTVLLTKHTMDSLYRSRYWVEM